MAGSKIRANVWVTFQRAWLSSGGRSMLIFFAIAPSGFWLLLGFSSALTSPVFGRAMFVWSAFTLQYCYSVWALWAALSGVRRRRESFLVRWGVYSGNFIGWPTWSCCMALAKTQNVSTAVGIVGGFGFTYLLFVGIMWATMLVLHVGYVFDYQGQWEKSKWFGQTVMSLLIVCFTLSLGGLIMLVFWMSVFVGNTWSFNFVTLTLLRRRETRQITLQEIFGFVSWWCIYLAGCRSLCLWIEAN